MSRIGNRKLTIPEGVNVTVNGREVTVSGKLGTLNLTLSPLVNVTVNDNVLETVVSKDTKEANIMVGTTNANLNNMLTGVTTGFKRELEAVGVGYRFAVAGNKITINAGYSNPVIIMVPDYLKVESPSNTELNVLGIDKQKVSEFAANIRKVREPEPYKGKGIRYKEEHVRRKEGKKASK